MKNKLSQITLAELVELYCGNSEVLLEDGDEKNSVALINARLEVLLEYRSVIDNAGYKRVLDTQRKSIVLNTKVTIFKMCQNLACVGGVTDIRDIYEEMRLNHRRLSDKELVADVKRRLKSAEFDYKRALEQEQSDIDNANEPSTPDEMRNAMIDDMAFVMTHYKMQIDPTTLNARAYATMRKNMLRELQNKRQTLNSLKHRR